MAERKGEGRLGILWVLAITVLAGMGGTGLGGAISCLLRRESDRMVSLLLSFAAGVMVAVVCFDLLADALTPESAGTTAPLGLVIGGVLAGYGAVCTLNAGIGQGRGRPQKQGRGGLLLAGMVMAAAIALHNVPEGMVIGASFAAGAGSLNRGGLMMAAVIGLHNIPEGMAVAAPLISGGVSKPRAAAISAVTGAPTVLGAAAGYMLGTMGPRMLAAALSFASGAMLYVVFGELLPEADGLWRSKAPALAAVIGMLVGMVMLYI